MQLETILNIYLQLVNSKDFLKPKKYIPIVKFLVGTKNPIIHSKSG